MEQRIYEAISNALEKYHAGTAYFCTKRAVMTAKFSLVSLEDTILHLANHIEELVQINHVKQVYSEVTQTQTSITLLLEDNTQAILDFKEDEANDND